MDQGHCLVVLNRQSAASHDIAVAVHIQTAVQAVLVYTRAYGDRYKVAGVIQLVPQGSTSRPLPDCRPRRWGAGAVTPVCWSTWTWRPRAFRCR